MSESERWSTRFGLFAGLTLGLWWAATWVVLWGVWYVVVLGATLVLPCSYCAWRAVNLRAAAGEDEYMPPGHPLRVFEEAVLAQAKNPAKPTQEYWEAKRAVLALLARPKPEPSEAVATKTELEQAESALRFLSNEANRRADIGMNCGRRILERALALYRHPPEPPE